MAPLLLLIRGWEGFRLFESTERTSRLCPFRNLLETFSLWPGGLALLDLQAVFVLVESSKPEEMSHLFSARPVEKAILWLISRAQLLKFTLVRNNSLARGYLPETIFCRAELPALRLLGFF